MQKSVIITGASRGIGKAIATELARQNLKVLLLARNAEDLAIIQAEIKHDGGHAEIYPCDISNQEEVEKVTEQILANHASIDCLVNNAGVGSFKETEAFDADEWDQIMNVNVKGSFLLNKYLLPHFKQQQKGHLITIASDVSKRTFAQGAVYCASKYAQDALMAGIRKEVRSYGIKVSTIYPGLVDTHFNNSTPGLPGNTENLQPEDIAQAVSYVLHAPAHVVVDELMLHPVGQEY